MSSSGSQGAAAIINPLTVLATAAALAPQLVEMNQSKQARKGAENAANEEKNTIDQQIANQKKLDQANLNQKALSASATNAQAIAAIRAALSSSTSSGNTVLTGGQGTTPAPIQQKTLLGV